MGYQRLDKTPLGEEASKSSSESDCNGDDGEDDGDTTTKCCAALGAIAILGVMVVAVLNSDLVNLSDSPGPPPVLQAKVRAYDDPHNTCLIHVSFGTDYKEINALTLPLKRQYAEQHGYRLQLFQAPTYKALMTSFEGCLDRDIFNVTGTGYDIQTLLKWCGIWRSFQDGCTSVMWTDADAIVHNRALPISYWTERNHDADAYWSVDDVGLKIGRLTNLKKNGWCQHEANGVRRFGSCLNTGVFIIRKNAWSEAWLQRTLDLSKEAMKVGCSTKTLNPLGFDQCRINPFNNKNEHVGDQCIVACNAQREPQNLNHYQLYGPNHSPRFQKVVIAAFEFPRALFFMRQLHISGDSYVINCAGHMNLAQLRECVRYVADFSQKNQPVNHSLPSHPGTIQIPRL